MRFLRRLLEPSYSRQADFDSLDEREAHYSFLCLNCSNKVSFSFADAIRHHNSWADEFDRKTVKLIYDYFGMKLLGESPDGGSPSILMIDCKACHTRFMVYASVAETSNLIHRVVIQSIAEIAQPE